MSELSRHESKLQGHRFATENERVRSDSPLEQYLVSDMTPGQLAEKWQEEDQGDASSDKVHHKRKRMQRPRFLARKNKTNEGEGVVKVEESDKDVRVWILENLGVPASELKKNPIDQHTAQELIAKGLKISQFEAALIDRSTRGVSTNMLGESLSGLLTNPAQFTNTKRELVDYAREIEGLEPKDWQEVVKDVKKIAPTSAPENLEELARELDAKGDLESLMIDPRASEVSNGGMLADEALKDVITARMERIFGKKRPYIALHYTEQLLAMWGKEISNGTRPDTPIHTSVINRLLREIGQTDGQSFLGGGPWEVPK